MPVAVMGMRMNQVIRKYYDANALDASRACSASTLGLREKLTHKQALRVLRRNRVLVEAAPGCYYLDVDALYAMRRAQCIIVGVAFGLMLLWLLVPLLFSALWQVF